MVYAQEEIWDALSGHHADQLNLRAGDEMVVDQTRSSDGTLWS
jgi:hypothetical protein